MVEVSEMGGSIFWPQKKRRTGWRQLRVEQEDEKEEMKESNEKMNYLSEEKKGHPELSASYYSPW